ncbi:MAG: DUF4595 domain-containing protein [Bacteroidaceae bacterium]|nr:DUF4595 domain-containing protein [Bacteroidaceae bacterium]
MKKSITLAGMMLLISAVMSAQNYYMVVEKNDGSKVAFPTTSISQVSFLNVGESAFQGPTRVFGSNLLKKFTYTSNPGTAYASTESWTYTYNSEGFITRMDITDEYYASIDYSAGNVVVTQSFDKSDGSLLRREEVVIGSNGYASSYSYTGDKGRVYRVEYTYSIDEQITDIVSYTDGEKDWGYRFEYSDGDLVKAYELEWEDDVLVQNKLYATIFYETDTQSKIDNVGGIMEFDHMMHIDCDMSEIFPFGAFGKPNKHLPLYVTYNTSTFTNTYTFDSAGRVIAATTVRTESDSDTTSTKSFTWEW